MLSADDPMGLGRVRALCPEVNGEAPLAWAIPCLPVGGPGEGPFAPPPAGAEIWLQFEAGDVARPVWMGRLPTRTAAGPMSPEPTRG